MIYFYIISFCCILFGCRSTDNEFKTKLHLVLDTIQHSKIDTLYVLENNNTKYYLLSITNSHGFGNIDKYLAISKQSQNKQDLRYIIKDANSISRQYIAISEVSNDQSFGWVFLKDEKILNKEIFFKIVLDSLRRNYPNSHIEGYGDKFLFKKQERVIKSLDYGNIVTKFPEMDFENLEYKLYKLQGDSIITLSNNGNDLLKQKNGVHYIPKPGFRVISKFSIIEVIKIVDSVSKLPVPPTELRISHIM